MSWGPELLRRQRRRLTVALTGVLILVLTGFGLIVYATFQQTLLARSDADNDFVADALQTAVRWSPQPGADPKIFEEEGHEMVEAHGLVVAQLHDAEGRQVYHFGPPNRVLPLASASRDVERGLRILRRSIPGPEGQRLTLVVGCNWAPMAETLQVARLRLILAITGCSLAAAAVAFGLAGWMLRPIQQAFDQQRRFIADAAHELRTPVAIVNAHLDVAQAEAPAPATGSLAAAIKGIHRLRRLIDDLLTLARIDAAVPDMWPFRLDELLEELQDDYTFLAQQAGVTLTGDPWPAITLTANPDQLRRLLRNLLDNAIRHTPPHGTVTITCHQQGDNGVQITVSDTGSGIPTAAQPHIFDRFYRGKQADHRSDGSGLGLAIAKAIALAHGGTLRCESRPGHGAVFILRLSDKPRQVSTPTG